MPTTPETSSRTTTPEEDSSDPLEDVYHSLRNSEATGEEAIATTIHAFTDIVREALPVAMSQPARFVDLTFELAQQTINLQRRFVFELLSSLQRVMTEALTDLESDSPFRDQKSVPAEHRTRTTRRAA